MRQKFRADSFPSSGRGLMHVCPGCHGLLELRELRDGDQAYWCPLCERGHRAGDPPLAALRPTPTS